MTLDDIIAKIEKTYHDIECLRRETVVRRLQLEYQHARAKMQKPRYHVYRIGDSFDCPISPPEGFDTWGAAEIWAVAHEPYFPDWIPGEKLLEVRPHNEREVDND